MASITVFLKSIGMEQHSAVFEQNAIEPDHLPDLDHDMLKEMGVVALGHRLTILRAAKELAAPNAIEEPVARIDEPAPVERRQLTVMFCDMMGSVEIGEQLELEDYRELLADFREALSGAITAESGYIARHQGDAVLAYFGYPHAADNDSERAVRAGLRIIGAVGRLRTYRDIKVKVRVGVATGPVVVGDVLATASSSESEYAAFGSTPNLAARLQGLANANELLVSATTYRLTGSRFDSMPGKEISVKGMAREIEAFQIIGERTVRHGDFWADDNTPIIGREKELDTLRASWSEARLGRGQVVVVGGQAGLGKSRLLRAFAAFLAGETCTIVPLQCSAYRDSNALYPITEWLNREARIGLTDSARARRRKLVVMLKNYLLDSSAYREAVLALVEQSCSMSDDALVYTASSNPGLSTLADIIVDSARQKPLLLFIEDYHWSDPTFAQFVEIVTESIVDVPVCIVITTRTDSSVNNIGHKHVNQLQLKALDRNDSETLVQHVAGEFPLNALLVDTICNRSDGIPLFLEEITRVFQQDLMASESEGDNPNSPALIVPERLQDSLMARLDKLGPAKYVAQVCAIIGRRFERRMLEYLVTLCDSALTVHLNTLARSEIIAPIGNAGTGVFAFKHVLVQETAYQSLLRQVRAEIHGKYAESLVAHFPQIAFTNPDLIAHHFTAARQYDAAVANWIRAGHRAVARSASPEALQCVDNGIHLIQQLEEKTDRQSLELQLRVIQGSAKLMSEGQGSDAVEHAYGRAMVLAKHADDDAVLFPALLGTWRYYIGSAALESAYEAADRLNDLAQAMNSRGHGIIAKMALANICFHNGKVVEALSYAREGLALGKHGEFNEEELKLFLIGQDPLVSLNFCAAFGCWLSGDREAAAGYVENGLARARALDQPFTLGMALTWISVLNQLGENPAQVRVAAQELRSLSETHELPWCYGFALSSSGWVKIKEGNIAAGVQEIQAGITVLEEANVDIFTFYSYGLLADGYRLGNQLEAAMQASLQAIDSLQEAGVRWDAPRLLIQKAQLAIGIGDNSIAEEALDAARTMARDLSMIDYELTAVVMTAELLLNKGKQQEARQLLKANSQLLANCTPLKHLDPLLQRIEVILNH